MIELHDLPLPAIGGRSVVARQRKQLLQKMLAATHALPKRCKALARGRWQFDVIEILSLYAQRRERRA